MHHILPNHTSSNLLSCFFCSWSVRIIYRVFALVISTPLLSYAVLHSMSHTHLSLSPFGLIRQKPHHWHTSYLTVGPSLTPSVNTSNTILKRKGLNAELWCSSTPTPKPVCYTNSTSQPSLKIPLHFPRQSLYASLEPCCPPQTSP